MYSLKVYTFRASQFGPVTGNVENDHAYALPMARFGQNIWQ